METPGVVHARACVPVCLRACVPGCLRASMLDPACRRSPMARHAAAHGLADVHMILSTRQKRLGPLRRRSSLHVHQPHSVMTASPAYGEQSIRVEAAPRAKPVSSFDVLGPLIGRSCARWRRQTRGSHVARPSSAEAEHDGRTRFRGVTVIVVPPT